MKTVDHSYEQALIMHDNVHIHGIMNIIMTPSLYSYNYAQNIRYCQKYTGDGLYSYNYLQNIQYCEENHEEQYLRWDLQLRQCKKYAKGCSDEVMKTYTTMHQKKRKVNPHSTAIFR